MESNSKQQHFQA